MLQEVFRKSRKTYVAYKLHCKQTNSRCLGPNWDVPTRWNSTCTMFECGLAQRESLQYFHINLCMQSDQPDAFHPFSNEDWDCIQEITNILQIFKTATTLLSGTYYPTSNLVLHQLYLIVIAFTNMEYQGPMYLYMKDAMKEKFIEYFGEIPHTFTCAAALNPTLNVSGVDTMIEEIVAGLGLDDQNPNHEYATQKKADFMKALQNMFDLYQNKYGPSNIQRDVSSSSTSSNTRRDGTTSLFNTIRGVNAKRQRGSTATSELGRYIGTDFLSPMTTDDLNSFDLLAWWKEKESQFPILAAMARDLLTVQASSVASESVFSLSGRILSVRRTRLTPTAMEMCICLKDHLDAEKRIQDKTTLEDEQDFEKEVHDIEVIKGLSPPLSDEEANE